MSSRTFKFLIALCIALFGVKVFAHARLKTTGALVPRSTNAGIKVGPCGGVARLATSPVYAPGATIQVDWEETINHPGRFEFYFSAANDANFTLLKSIPDNQDGGGLPHQYTTTITLPNVTCTACTLQMIQVMTENPAMPSLYYSCADLQLQMGAVNPPVPAPTPVPVPAPVPAPTPTPTPSPDACH